MKKYLLLATCGILGIAGSAFVACTNGAALVPSSDGGATNPDGGTGTDSGPLADTGPGKDTGPGADTGTDAGPPAPPTLGAQIDRMGRPAINTALNHGFDGTAATAGPAKDAYNADKTPAGWVASYQPQFAGNLGILDSLNTGASADGGGGCGDQPYAQNDAGADRYKTLSSVLAADMLWLNTASAACTTYLAVELNATGVVANTDCGGRALTYDVIQTTYSVTSGVGLSGFGSGVSAVAAKTNGTTFPYLATPL